MVATPFFGPFSVTRSTNLADNQLINLRPESVDTKDGKAIGALMGTPGLVLTVTLSAGPLNGMRPLGGLILYAVSGKEVYTIDPNYAATLVGAVAGGGGRVSMIDNGTQITIFTDTDAYTGPAGYQLTGGTIGGNGGINFGVGDTIVLSALDGTQTAAAILEVTSVKGGGAITDFKINQAGAFPQRPSGLEQQSTTGSGSDFTLTALTFSAGQDLCHLSLPFSVGTGGQTISATFLDGFGLANQPGTNALWQSDATDISVWPALNFAFAAGASDYVQALAELHRLVFVVKQRTTEVWNDAGTTGFSFQPLSSTLIEHGTVSWATVQRVGDSIAFLSRSSEGQGVVRALVGLTPKRISTHAIETLMNSALTLEDAYAFAYQQDGHQFYVLTVPALNLTFAYDKTESEVLGVAIWHQWLTFANGQFSRHWGNVFAFFNQQSLVGDYRNGNIYRLDLSVRTDNNLPRKWLRSWRALKTPVMQPIRFSSLQIDMQTGIGIAPDANPQVMLRWSDDGGHNFSVEHMVAVGKTGETSKRVRFNRLGSTKRNSGLDRIFELSSTDAFPVALIGAELDV